MLGADPRLKKITHYGGRALFRKFLWLFVSFTISMTISSRLPSYGSCRLAPTNHSCYAVLPQARHLLGRVVYENNSTNLFYNMVDRHLLADNVSEYVTEKYSTTW